MCAIREDHFRVAIIGGGPRGLAALESLCSALTDSALAARMQVILFEASTYRGSGPNYAPDQFSGSLLNLPERELDIPPRADMRIARQVVAGFPSYKKWADADHAEGGNQRVDRYPARARLGHYLQSRFNSMALPLESAGWLTIVESEVLQVRWDATVECHVIEHAAGAVARVDEVVLAIGHQPTAPGKDMRAWMQHADQHPDCRLVTEPYPLESHMRDESIAPGCTVALRGFGLSMIDVVKGLTEGRGGRFVVADDDRRTMIYEPSGREPGRIAPFSLDGLPMAPKPLNRHLDDCFRPGSLQEQFFEKQCSILAEHGEGKRACRQLINLISHIQVAVFLRVRPDVVDHYSPSRLFDIAVSWLRDEDYRHELIVDRDLPAEHGMQLFIDMACGLEPPGFDYCLGQVWRHLQKIMFRAFSHSSLSVEAISDLVELHERMKRYTYGPPVDNAQCLLALLRSRHLTFAFVDDPETRLVEEGWELVKGADRMLATVMIDTVLSSPILSKVGTPLIRQLLDEARLIPLSESLGASTREGSVAVQGEALSASPPVALLGRLATGSILGADSITESFGHEQREWAGQLIKRVLESRCPD
ncbi:FAD/NAD(P)-binding protein [Granulosicoccus sp. 3-233]|uniref:FAD/NAD(P)-binding protein n=1 Tax=Granulosicoccus sp. 3-233 TaxID=3417969 RepID=UPI003D34738A